MARLEAQLHAKNRIWLGEDVYAWHLARLLGAIGRDFAEALKDKPLHRDFGHGYESGRLSKAEKVDAMLARLRARLVR